MGDERPRTLDDERPADRPPDGPTPAELGAALLAMTQDGVWAINARGETVYVNQRLVELLGYRSAAELLGRPVESFVFEEDLPAHRERMRARRRGESDRYERRFRRADGGELWCRISATALHDAAGGFAGSIAVLTDITEEHRTAAKLQVMVEMLDSAPSSITVHDFEGRFLYANEMTFRLHGYSGEEFLGLRLQDIDVPESAALIESRIREIRERGTATFEVRHRRCDGSTFPLEVFAKRVTWLGRPALLSIANDLSKHRRLEQRFLQAQKMEAVGRLAGGLAHDFNNILTVVQSYAGVALERLREGDPLRDDLEQILHAGQRAADLTRRLLALSGRQLLAPVTLDLNRLVTDLEKLLHRLLGEDVALRLELAPELGAIHADPGQLEQVLMNLAVNARDAMPDGGKLTVATADVLLDDTRPPSLAGLPPGPYVRLSVTDDGCGMSEETLSHLFEPFFTTKAPGRGTGLGMPTVYAIVMQSGGGLVVRSATGRGTTVEVYLPRTDDEPRQASVRPPASDEVPGGGETVLVAEDDEQVRNLAARILRDAGYRVLVAADGEQAVELAARHPDPIHLLLTDVVMPGLGGRQLAQRLVAARPAVRVLFMSGHADDPAFHETAGDDELPFVPKPFAPTQLRAKVRAVLDANR